MAELTICSCLVSFQVENDAYARASSPYGLEALAYAKIISRAKISEIFEQAGFTSIKWLMEDVSNYYQPIILATK